LPRITTNQVAMGVGVAGAMVDVTSYANLVEGVSRSWGRQSEFDDTPPGEFSFSLDNADGRFTPGNSSSPLDTTLTEGMDVCWNLGGRLVAGTIRSIQPEFPGGESAWARVRITCDDMLGDAGRTDMDSVWDGILESAGLLLSWPLNDSAEATKAAEAGGGFPLSPYRLLGPVTGVTFGVENFPEFPGTAVTLNCGTTVDDRIGLGTTADRLGAASAGYSAPPIADIQYPTASAGYWGVWVDPVNIGILGATPQTRAELWVRQAGLEVPFNLRVGPVSGSPSGTGLRLSVGTTPDVTYNLSASEATNPLFAAMGITAVFGGTTWLVTATAYVNGTAVASAIYDDATMVAGAVPHYTNADKQPTWVAVEVRNTGFEAAPKFARLSHTLELPREELSPTTTEAGQLKALAATVPALNLDTPPAALSSSPVTSGDDGGSALSKMNTVIRTEQGYLYTETSGSLLAPVQKVVVRERTRPETVSFTFDVEDDGSGSPEFIRSIEDLVSAVTVSGPLADTLVTDATLKARAGSANVTETTLHTGLSDQIEWGQDRLQRGANTQLKLATVTIDAMTTLTDRSADLLALTPGDRVRFTGLPSTQLGFDEWDGWLLGVDENHTVEEHKFELHFQPVLPATAIFDTNRFMADGALTLSAAIVSAVATTMSVATTGPKLETVDVPYALLVDDEQVTVTACTGATPQVATITRGVNGTTATTHTTAATIELATESLFAF
jgi:hypothetical protein